MKVLMVHNYYQQPGGEDQSFAAESALLNSYGHRVRCFSVHNDQIRNMNFLNLAVGTLWNRSSCAMLRHLIQKERPEIVHFQNIFPLISPAAYYVAKAEGIPVIQTLRNYRLLCPNALFFREGHVCKKCLGKLFPWPGVIHACYRKNWAASGVVATMLALHRLMRTWKRMVDVYIALTEFSRREFIENGLPQGKVVVKPNFIYSEPGERKRIGDYALYVGRISQEKGLMVLLQAWQSLKRFPLKIVGSGPQTEKVQSFLRKNIINKVTLLGQQNPATVIDLMKKSQFLIFPSEWYEGFPRTIVEAFACGVPVIASRLGAMAQIIDDGRTGLLFKPGDAKDLAAKVEWAWAHPKEMAEMGLEARKEFEEKYTAERNYEMLMEIYERAISSAKMNMAG